MAVGNSGVTRGEKRNGLMEGRAICWFRQGRFGKKIAQIRLTNFPDQFSRLTHFPQTNGERRGMIDGRTCNRLVWAR